MRYGFTRHARRKMIQLGLTVDDVLGVVHVDDVIERYEDRDGALLYGDVGGLELHVALAAVGQDVTLVTTVYAVDRTVFPDGRTRRRHA